MRSSVMNSGRYFEVRYQRSMCGVSKARSWASRSASISARVGLSEPAARTTRERSGTDAAADDLLVAEGVEVRDAEIGGALDELGVLHVFDAHAEASHGESGAAERPRRVPIGGCGEARGSGEEERASGEVIGRLTVPRGLGEQWEASNQHSAISGLCGPRCPMSDCRSRGRRSVGVGVDTDFETTS